MYQDSLKNVYNDIQFCFVVMPEWKGLNLMVETLKGGITNKLLKVQLPTGESYVIRIFGSKTELFIDRENEVENLRQVEALGVSPRLIKYLPEKNTMVVEFIPGRPLTNSDFTKTDLLEKIIRPIKLIHKSHVKFPKLFDPLQQIISMYKVLRTIGSEYPEFDIMNTLRSLEKLSSLANVSYSDYVPCHNDLLADNFILVEDNEKDIEPIFLIDWEYAGMSTPYYDISDMLQEILVPREIEEDIIRMYWEDKNLEEHIYKTDLFKPFPDIYWFLWSLIQLNLSKINFDYYSYGKDKFRNAQSNICEIRKKHNINV
jgi:thiamine kinase-like enzyme